MESSHTLLLGYLPQELNGTSLYEHIQFDDIAAISECHRNALKQKEEVCTPYFRFRAKDGKFVKLESKWKQFRNPWTKEIEYLICKDHLLIKDEKLKDGGSFVDSGDMNFFLSLRVAVTLQKTAKAMDPWGKIYRV